MCPLKASQSLFTMLCKDGLEVFCHFRAGQREKCRKQNHWSTNHSGILLSCRKLLFARDRRFCNGYVNLSAEGKFIFTEAGLNIWKKATSFTAKAVDKLMAEEIESVDVWKLTTWKWQITCNNKNPIFPKELNTHNLFLLYRSWEIIKYFPIDIWKKKQTKHEMIPLLWHLHRFWD